MSTEITLVGQTYEPTSVDQAYHMAKVLLESGMLPKTIRTPEGAFAIMVAGKELGMTAMQSFRSINIIDGPFKGFDGSINDIDVQKGKLKVLVNMFGRETPVELDSLQVKRV